MSGQALCAAWWEKRPITPARRVGSLLFVSGNGCNDFCQGRVGEDVTPEQGYAACRNIVLRILHVVRDTVGSLDEIDHVVSAFGLINAAPGCTWLEAVFDGCSDALYELLGDRGIAPRLMMGTGNLPSGNTVAEIELVFCLKNEKGGD